MLAHFQPVLALSFAASNSCLLATPVYSVLSKDWLAISTAGPRTFKFTPMSALPLCGMRLRFLAMTVSAPGQAVTISAGAPHSSAAVSLRTHQLAQAPWTGTSSLSYRLSCPLHKPVGGTQVKLQGQLSRSLTSAPCTSSPVDYQPHTSTC